MSTVSHLSFRLALMVLAVLGGGQADVLAEDAVELREAVKAAVQRSFSDRDGGIDQHSLHVANLGHLNIIGQGEAGYVLELVGKVVAADEELLRQHFQGQFLGVMSMDVAGYGVHLFFRGGHFGTVGIEVVLLVQVQKGEKLNEFQVDDQVPHGVLFLGEQEDIVQFAVDFLLQFRLKAENGYLLVKDAQQLLVFVAQAVDPGRQAELDDQPLAGIALGVLGHVQHVGPQTDDVELLQAVGFSLQKMLGVGFKHHTQLIEGVEVLELHVDLGRADIVIEKVEQAVVFVIDADKVLVLVEGEILYQHSAPLCVGGCRIKTV